MFDRLLHLKPFFNLLESTHELKCNLSTTQWHMVEQITTLLEPFMVFQELLEEQNYSTIGMVPFIIYKIRKGLKEVILSPTNCTYLVTDIAKELLIDFNERWGNGQQVLSENEVRGYRNRQKGIPFLCLLGAALDPRFKSLIGVPEGERQGIWDLLEQFCIQTVTSVNTTNEDICASTVTSEKKSTLFTSPESNKSKKKNVTSYIEELINVDEIELLPAPKLSVSEVIKAEIFHNRSTPVVPVITDNKLTNP
jgi:hypothetical protein